MSALSSDTHPKMEALQIKLLRQASPTRKMNAPVKLFARLALHEINMARILSR
jgi:hypothetical protein